MTMNLLAFVRIDLCLLLTLFCPFILAGFIQEASKTRVLSKLLGIIVAIWAYLFCFLTLTNTALDGGLLKIGDPAAINFCLMLISYTALILSVGMVVFIEAILEVLYDKKAFPWTHKCGPKADPCECNSIKNQLTDNGGH
jgi:hypothetical protein